MVFLSPKPGTEEGIIRPLLSVAYSVGPGIKEAPEPETIVWSHLEYSRGRQDLRKVMVMIAVVIILCIGVLGILFSNVKKTMMRWELSCDTMLNGGANSTARLIPCTPDSGHTYS